MTKALEDVRDRAQVSGSILEATLRGAGIDPIPQKMVKEYMKKERRRAPKADFVGWALHHLGVSKEKFEWIVGTGAIIMLVAGFFVGFAAGCLVLSMSGPAEVLWIPVAGFATLLTGAVLLWVSEKLLWLGPAHWHTLTVDHTVPLPKFAEQKLNRIREIDDTVRFEMAELRQGVYTLDPVLFAIGPGGEKIAFCIWDELRQEIFLT